MLEKGFASRADVLVPDLEDSVPVDEKANARAVVTGFLPKLAAAGRTLIPRVNSMDTGWLEKDLSAIVGPHIVGVSVGKIQGPEDIATIANILDGLEKKAGLEPGHVKLVPWIETARAIVKVYDICLSSPRIIGVALGAEDLTTDMGIERQDDDSEIAYASNVLCVAAKAADVLALDTPYFQFRDAEGLRRDALDAKKCGFKGKFAIHPAQIDTINEIFSPSLAEIEYARRVVAAFEEAEHRGRGSTSLDGKVIDVPVVKRARALLDTVRKFQATSSK